VWLAAGMVGLLLGVGAWWVLDQRAESTVVTIGDTDQVREAPVGTVDADGSVLSAARAREFEQAVNARDPQRLADVLLLGEDHDPVAVAEQALPAGSQLVVDERSFARVGDEGAVVEAEIVGAQQFSVRLLLVEVDGRWLLAGSSEPEPTS
jgi:hypothetical protein